MSILPSDPNGFLTSAMKENLDRMAQELEVLRAIQADTAATLSQLTSIAHSLTNPPAPPGRPPTPRPVPSVPPGARPPRSPAPPRSPVPPGPAVPPTPPAPTPDRQRDENGRFRPRAPTPPGPTPDSPARDGQNSNSRATEAMGDAAESMKGAASAVAAGADGIDPTVQAVKEIGGIFQPVMGVLRPMGRVFGIGRKSEQRENVSWYRRIWSAVKGERGGSGGNGLIMTALLSVLGMLLAPIRALSKLTGLSGLLKGAASMLPGRRAPSAGSRRAPAPAPGTGPGSRTGPTPVPGQRPGPVPRPPGRGMVKGLLKKLPLIGALIGGGMLASDVLAPDDSSLTAEQNKQQRYGNVGGGIGGLVGGAVGMFGGPAGAIAGAMIGDQIGGMVGEWLATVDLGSVPGKIVEVFTSLKDSTLEVATKAFASIQGAWKGMVVTGTKLLKGMAEGVKEAFGKVVDAALSIKDTVDDKIQSAKDYASAKAVAAADAVKNTAYKASGGRLGTDGSNARKDELIKAMDAGGITDPKSKAMLMANVDHESGGFTANEENLNYSAKRLQEVFPKYYSTPEAARADANNPEAIANKVYGGRMGNTEAGDGFKYRGRGNIQLTGKAQYAEMGKKLGIDLVNNPDLAMDPKYSAQIAVQHWKSSGADKAAMAGDQVRARQLTNGGTNGLADVQGKYDGYLAQAQAGELTPTRRADQGKVQAPEGANVAVASTMAALKGAPAVGVMPIGPRPSGAPAMPGAQTVGVMAPTVSTPAMGTAAIKPISASSMMAPRYSAPAPDASQFKLPPAPVVEKPLMTPSKTPTPSVQFAVPLTQNVEDRQIAHAASGGIGMN